MVFCLEMTSAIFMKFLSKNRKTLKVGKMEIHDEKKVFFREEDVLISLEAFFYTNGKAQNLPVVAIFSSFHELGFSIS